MTKQFCHYHLTQNQDEIDQDEIGQDEISNSKFLSFVHVNHYQLNRHYNRRQKFDSDNSDNYN